MNPFNLRWPHTPTKGTKASDLDIPPPPRPADHLRSLSQRLMDALGGGGPFDRAGYDGRRIIRDAVAEMLTIAAEVEHDRKPEHGWDHTSSYHEPGLGDEPLAVRSTGRPALVVVK